METIEQPKSLVDQTHDILLNAICSGEFEPGERLNQDEIASRLNVSRQPVNSAISMLKANGFVQDTGRRGVIVSKISAEQFLSIYEFRSAIEPFAVRLAHDRKPADAASEARQLLDRGWQAARSRDAQAQAQIMVDVEFHEMIYRWSGNATIEATMKMNWHHIRRSMGVVVRQGVAAETSWDEHTRIIEALLKGDADDAAREMKDHIERAQAKTAAILARRAPAESPIPR